MFYNKYILKSLPDYAKLMLLFLGSQSYALPFGIDELSISAGFTRTTFNEQKILDDISLNSSIFFTDTLSPELQLSFQKGLFKNRVSLCLEASYTFTSKNDYASANNGQYGYRTKTYLWDAKSFIMGPEVGSYRARLGLGFGYGRACYINRYPALLPPYPTDRSHGILPLLVLKIGNPHYNSHLFNFKLGMNTMSDYDKGYSPYVEANYSYLFKSSKSKKLDHCLKVKYLNWNNPYVISQVISIPSQKSLFLGYELRFR